MNIKIRLIKDWSNAGKSWPKGQLLMTSEQSADQLVKDGIAELYNAKADDIIVSATDNGGLTAEEFRKTIKDVLDEQAKALRTTMPPIASGNETVVKTGGWQNFAEMAKDVFKAGPHGRSASEKLQKWEQVCKTTGVMEEGDDSQGGYLVPTEFRAQLLETAIEKAIIRPRATIIPMATNSVSIPFVNDASHASSTHGGIIIYRPDEYGAKTPSKPTLGKVMLTLHKLIGMVYVTDELLEDSPISIEPLITRMFGEAIAYQEDDDFVNGTGANMALGILNAPCIVSVAKEGAQGADTIWTENIVKMYSRMTPGSLGSAVWMANNNCFPQLCTLSLNVGTGGAPMGLIRDGIAGAPGMTMLGRPLILTEHCATIGDTGDIVFADWSQYLIGSKASGLQVATSIHFKFDYDATAFRFVLRYDGQPWWPAALTPRRGSTLSPFVKLDAR